MVISKKAVNPKGVILPTIFLTVLFLAIGYGLTKGGRDDFADVGNYLIGNVNEEHVVIKEFRVDVTPERLFYRYTFEDGRTFIERYKGKGFSSVREGDSYYIRYLPRTKKILRIEPS